MQRRPQSGVGKALVVAAVMLRRHVDGRKRAAAERLDLGKGISCLRGIARVTTICFIAVAQGLASS